jgi:L-lactate dehydrogenase
VKAILNNEQAVLPVSAYLNGEYGEKDLFTGVPSVVDQHGVREIIELNIDPEERKKFAASSKQLREVIHSLDTKKSEE